jgi:hypothetical protein
MKKKQEKWIGSKYFGTLRKICRNCYYLSVYSLWYTDGQLHVKHHFIKEYRFKQSAIRYIKRNFNLPKDNF